VTAPGIEILAGRSPQPWSGAIASGPPGDLYMAIAGTSMSSPHAAGASALVKAAHPSWTPGQIKSALMTSSIQNVLREDGVAAANPFDTGAGSIPTERSVRRSRSMNPPPRMRRSRLILCTVSTRTSRASTLRRCPAL